MVRHAEHESFTHPRRCLLSPISLVVGIVFLREDGVVILLY